MRRDDDPRIAEAVRRGCRYLVDRMARGALDEPNPIGLYFASLWYSEKLYPTIWTVAALGRVIAHCAASPARSRQRR
jgi:squalene-hopene/tetraprenyl-beta-curcumene cyclase